MKSYVGKQCRCGCTGCSENHHLFQRTWVAVTYLKRLFEVIESIIKIPWTVFSIPTVLQLILIFFIGNYIFLLFNERLLKWSLFCPSLKMVEVHFFTDMNKVQILQWTVYAVIVYWGLWSNLVCKLLNYVAQKLCKGTENDTYVSFIHLCPVSWNPTFACCIAVEGSGLWIFWISSILLWIWV